MMNPLMNPCRYDSPEKKATRRKSRSLFTSAQHRLYTVSASVRHEPWNSLYRDDSAWHVVLHTYLPIRPPAIDRGQPTNHSFIYSASRCNRRGLAVDLCNSTDDQSSTWRARGPRPSPNPLGHTIHRPPWAPCVRRVDSVKWKMICTKRNYIGR
jgi:hypothetical protein